MLDRDELRATTQQHFEEAIRRIPNLNLSGEGSRARYFQLRGVGELEQYDGAPNPSIGFIVDDIDFSGLGSIGTLFDIDRVEVLRGPQGTRYGANALGGLVYMRSQAPSAELAADFEATTGSDGTRALGAAVGGPLGDALGLQRVGAQLRERRLSRQRVSRPRRHLWPRRADGARQARVVAERRTCRSTSRASTSTSTTATTRGPSTTASTTYSDDPGRDAQRSAAGSVRVQARARRRRLVSITGFADTDAVVQLRCRLGQRGVLGAVRLRLGDEQRSRAAHA